MTFQEKSAWVVLAATALMFGPYAKLLVEGRLPEPGDIGAMFALMIAFTVLIVVSHIGLAVVFPKSAGAPRDERDKRIELHAERAAGFALGAWMLGAIVVALLDGAPRVATVIFLGLVASEFVKSLWQVAQYRRGS